LAGLVSLHPGRAPKEPVGKLEARVLERTLKHTPKDGSTHWSSLMRATTIFACRHRALAHGALYVGSAAIVCGCTSMPWLGSGESTTSAVPQRAQIAGAPVPAGYYRVNPGDTLTSIAAAFGQRPQDIATWNRLPNAAPVAPGRVLRVAPPVATGGVSPAEALAGEPAVKFAWPARGAVIAPFQPGKSKGIVIADKPGQPVMAAADGRVVYVGSAIKAYGPLIVIKHSNSLVTAYARNGKLLVKEGDAVKGGQEIAEMGVDASGRGTVEFEIRKDGTPVNPLAYLPQAGD
jgi:lipoprotein NlpD